MQIYEITEGLLGNMLSAATGNYSGLAQSAASSLQQKGYGTTYKTVNANELWPEKLKTVQKDPAVQQYIAGMVKAWQAQSKTTVPEAVDPDSISAASSGKPTPADYAKLQQKIVAASGTTPGTPPPTTPGKETFETWSDAQLFSRVPGIGTEIKMEEIRQLKDLGPKLQQALAKVNGAAGTPVEAVAMKQYLELAIAGIQAKSQEIRSMRATGSKLSGKYARSTGNAQADAVLKAAGFNLS